MLTAVADEFGITRPLIYAGFSQGVAMAFRTAALVQRPCDGLLLLASDVPPDVAPLAASLPKILLGRGTQDEFYSAAQAAKDLGVLRAAGVSVRRARFRGWAPVDTGIYRASADLSMNSSVPDAV